MSKLVMEVNHDVLMEYIGEDWWLAYKLQCVSRLLRAKVNNAVTLAGGLTYVMEYGNRTSGPTRWGPMHHAVYPLYVGTIKLVGYGAFILACSMEPHDLREFLKEGREFNWLLDAMLMAKSLEHGAPRLHSLLVPKDEVKLTKLALRTWPIKSYYSPSTWASPPQALWHLSVAAYD